MTENFKLNKDSTVAVATDYFWEPIGPHTPRGVKLQLLGSSGVATYGLYDGKNPFWTHFAPLPRMPKPRED